MSFTIPSFHRSGRCHLAAFLVLGPCATASTLVFSRTQTLEGWHERQFTTAWTDLAADVQNLIAPDIVGDLRGFNHPTTTTWLQSPAFTLAAGDITFSQLYLMDGADAAPASDAGVSSTKSSTGWAGIALRDYSGNFVYTYSTPTEWQPVTLTAATLEPWVGQVMTLDLISMNNSNGDFFHVNRPITIPGSLSTVPEPASLLSVAGLLGSGLVMRRRSGRARA